MKRATLVLSISLLLFTLVAFSALTTSSADDEIGPYKQLTTIAITSHPPGLHGFDISWVDTPTETYYLADRTATLGAGRIDVIDAEHDNFLYSIGGFVGAGPTREQSGPDGVVVIDKRGELGAREGHDRLELWAGDGDSTAKVVDLETKSIVDTISTGGSFRADELCYDPTDKIIMIANDADTPPFVTFMSAEAPHPVLAHLSFSQANGGLEQCVWDPQRHKFYISVPSTFTNANGEVDEIDPQTLNFTDVVFQITNPAGSGPAGLVLLPGQRLMTSTGVVIDIKTGNQTLVSGVSGDEIWYNPGDNRVYFGNEPVFVVDASTLQLVATFDAGNTHTLAVDAENNHLFVPFTDGAGGGGVAVFTDSKDQEGRPGK